MARQCTICDHPQREAIDMALTNGDSHRSVARLFDGATKTSLGRHFKAGHVGNMALDVTFERVQPELLSGNSILREMGAMRIRARAIEAKAVQKGQLSVALQAIREQNRIIENLISLAAVLKNTGQYGLRAEINIPLGNKESWR